MERVSSKEFNRMLDEGEINFSKNRLKTGKSFRKNARALRPKHPDMQRRKKTVKEKANQKYNNEKTPYNGVLYDSKAEANYAQNLDLKIKKGRLIKWSRQDRYNVFINDKYICFYKLDFTEYYADGTIRYIDVKGVRTAVFNLKKKMIEALYDIEITLM